VVEPGETTESGGRARRDHGIGWSSPSRPQSGGRARRDQNRVVEPVETTANRVVEPVETTAARVVEPVETTVEIRS